MFSEDEKEVKGQPRDGKADTDSGQDHHHFPVTFYFPLLPAGITRKSGIFSENKNFISFSGRFQNAC